MKIVVTIEIEDDELVDEEHETGLTNEGFELLTNRLSAVGSIADIEAVKEEDA